MLSGKLKIFISSVQKEFQEQRNDLKAFLLGDPTLRRFISEVFLFEEVPAKDKNVSVVYLNEVEKCDIYLGILGYEYGHEDKEGLSPTEIEFNHATKLKKTRMIYVWGEDDKRRHPKMQQLVMKSSDGLIRKRVDNANALLAAVYESLVEHLEEKGVLKVTPFDMDRCDAATLKSLSTKRMQWFLETARQERGFPLKQNTLPKALLTHLNLLDASQIKNAALLLFGINPQAFYPQMETKCIHIHGTDYKRPFPSYQIYKGDIFSQVDQAQDFVLSKISRSVGVRDKSLLAPAEYELPQEAVNEAIVNALAHRDYNSKAAVEIRLFADRLEVWNPGSLPSTLTPEDLRLDHASVPNNPHLAESLYLARYIEKAGSGTQAMIEKCREAGLPEPSFEQRTGSFVVTLWRDWLTDEVIPTLGLNVRQVKALAYLKTNSRISNPEYQAVTGASKKTATRDLLDLKQKGIVAQRGVRGPGVHYILAPKRDNKGTMGT